MQSAPGHPYREYQERSGRRTASGLYRVHVRRECCCCRRNHDTRAGCSLQLVDDPLVHCHIKFSFVSGAEPRTHDDTDFFALPFSVVRKDITGFSRKRKIFSFSSSPTPSFPFSALETVTLLMPSLSARSCMDTDFLSAMLPTAPLFVS